MKTNKAYPEIKPRARAIATLLAVCMALSFFAAPLPARAASPQITEGNYIYAGIAPDGNPADAAFAPPSQHSLTARGEHATDGQLIPFASGVLGDAATGDIVYYEVDSGFDRRQIVIDLLQDYALDSLEFYLADTTWIWNVESAFVRFRAESDANYSDNIDAGIAYYKNETGDWGDAPFNNATQPLKPDSVTFPAGSVGRYIILEFTVGGMWAWNWQWYPIAAFALEYFKVYGDAIAGGTHPARDAQYLLREVYGGNAEGLVMVTSVQSDTDTIIESGVGNITVSGIGLDGAVLGVGAFRVGTDITAPSVTADDVSVAAGGGTATASLSFLNTGTSLVTYDVRVSLDGVWQEIPKTSIVVHPNFGDRITEGNYIYTTAGSISSGPIEFAAVSGGDSGYAAGSLIPFGAGTLTNGNAATGITSDGWNFRVVIDLLKDRDIGALRFMNDGSWDTGTGLRVLYRDESSPGYTLAHAHGGNEWQRYDAQGNWINGGGVQAGLGELYIPVGSAARFIIVEVQRWNVWGTGVGINAIDILGDNTPATGQAPYTAYQLIADTASATGNTPPEPPSEPAVDSIAAAPADLPYTGGASAIAITGQNLAAAGVDILIGAFAQGNGTGTPDIAAADYSGSDAGGTATLVFPGNEGNSGQAEYTVKVSLDGGISWLPITAGVTVAAEPGTRQPALITQGNYTYAALDINDNPIWAPPNYSWWGWDGTWAWPWDNREAVAGDLRSFAVSAIYENSVVGTFNWYQPPNHADDPAHARKPMIIVDLLSEHTLSEVRLGFTSRGSDWDAVNSVSVYSMGEGGGGYTLVGTNATGYVSNQAGDGLIFPIDFAFEPGISARYLAIELELRDGYTCKLFNFEVWGYTDEAPGTPQTAEWLRDSIAPNPDALRITGVEVELTTPSPLTHTGGTATVRVSGENLGSADKAILVGAFAGASTSPASTAVVFDPADNPGGVSAFPVAGALAIPSNAGSDRAAVYTIKVSADGGATWLPAIDAAVTVPADPGAQSVSAGNYIYASWSDWAAYAANGSVWESVDPLFAWPDWPGWNETAASGSLIPFETGSLTRDDAPGAHVGFQSWDPDHGRYPPAGYDGTPVRHAIVIDLLADRPVESVKLDVAAYEWAWFNMQNFSIRYKAENAADYTDAATAWQISYNNQGHGYFDNSNWMNLTGAISANFGAAVTARFIIIEFERGSGYRNAALTGLEVVTAPSAVTLGPVMTAGDLLEELIEEIDLAAPRIIDLSAAPGDVAFTGGTKTVTLTGENLDLASNIVLGLFAGDTMIDGATGSPSSTAFINVVGATATGVSTSVIFPSNAGSATPSAYTVRASLDGGSTWSVRTLQVAVAADPSVVLPEPVAQARYIYAAVDSGTPVWSPPGWHNWGAYPGTEPGLLNNFTGSWTANNTGGWGGAFFGGPASTQLIVIDLLSDHYVEDVNVYFGGYSSAPVSADSVTVRGRAAGTGPYVQLGTGPGYYCAYYDNGLVYPSPVNVGGVTARYLIIEIARSGETKLVGFEVIGHALEPQGTSQTAGWLLASIVGAESGAFVSSTIATPDSHASGGGTSAVTATGLNFEEVANLSENVLVAAFLGSASTPAVYGTDVSVASNTTITASITFPANATSLAREYVIQASINGGATWYGLGTVTVAPNLGQRIDGWNYIYTVNWLGDELRSEAPSHAVDGDTDLAFDGTSVIGAGGVLNAGSANRMVQYRHAAASDGGGGSWCEAVQVTIDLLEDRDIDLVRIASGAHAWGPAWVNISTLRVFVRAENGIYNEVYSGAYPDGYGIANIPVGQMARYVVLEFGKGAAGQGNFEWADTVLNYIDIFEAPGAAYVPNPGTPANAVQLFAEAERAIGLTENINPNEPRVISVTASPAGLPVSGGDSVITVSGVNFDQVQNPANFRVGAFLPGNATRFPDVAGTGVQRISDNYLTAEINGIPANAGFRLDYDVKVSYDGGNTWAPVTGVISVAGTIASPPGIITGGRYVYAGHRNDIGNPFFDPPEGGHANERAFGVLHNFAGSQVYNNTNSSVAEFRDDGNQSSHPMILADLGRDYDLSELNFRFTCNTGSTNGLAGIRVLGMAEGGSWGLMGTAEGYWGEHWVDGITSWDRTVTVTGQSTARYLIIELERWNLVQLNNFNIWGVESGAPGNFQSAEWLLLNVSGDPTLPAVTRIQASPSVLSYVGGTSSISVGGVNFTQVMPPDIKVGAFRQDNMTNVPDAVASGVELVILDSEITAVLEFERNSKVAARDVYTIMVSLDGGATWSYPGSPATVTVDYAEPGTELRITTGNYAYTESWNPLRGGTDMGAQGGLIPLATGGLSTGGTGSVAAHWNGGHEGSAGGNWRSGVIFDLRGAYELDMIRVYSNGSQWEFVSQIVVRGMADGGNSFRILYSGPWPGYGSGVNELSVAVPEGFDIRYVHIQIEVGANPWLNSNLNLVEFFRKDGSGVPQQLAADNFSTLVGRASASAVLMDRWGQANHENWPGKLPNSLEAGTAQLRSEYFEELLRYADFSGSPGLKADIEQRIAAADLTVDSTMQAFYEELSVHINNTRDPHLFSRWGGYKRINPTDADETGYVGNTAAASKHNGEKPFQLRLIDGVWWFVDPDGYLFLANGVDTANYYDSTGYGTYTQGSPGAERGSRGIFEWLPDSSTHGLAYSWTTDVNGAGAELVSFLVYNLMVKYGTTSQQVLSSRVAEIMQARYYDWGFNTFTKWGGTPGITMPYMYSLRTPAWGDGNQGNYAYFPGVEDPFGAEFVDNLYSHWLNIMGGASGLASLANDPYLIGYTYHNEVGFDHYTINNILMHEGWGGRNTSTAPFMGVTPAKYEWAMHAKEFYTERFGSEAAGLSNFKRIYSNIRDDAGGRLNGVDMNRAMWIAHVNSISSWDDVVTMIIPYWWNSYGRQDVWSTFAISANADDRAMHEQIFDFILYASDVYYSKLRQAIERFDTKNLILGTSSIPGYHSSIEWDIGGAEHLDAISIDQYSSNYNWMNTEVRGKSYTDGGTPLLNLEMAFSVQGRGMRSYNDQVNSVDQNHRGERAYDYIRGQYSSPYFVGYGWFQLYDQNIAGRPIGSAVGSGGENFQYGFMNQQDQPYDEFLYHIRNVNHNAAMYHAAAPKIEHICDGVNCDICNPPAYDCDICKDIGCDVCNPPAFADHDLNKDGSVGLVDLAIVALSAGLHKDDPRWHEKIAVDSLGGAITPAMCDFDGSGEIDMLDLMEVLYFFTWP